MMQKYFSWDFQCSPEWHMMSAEWHMMSAEWHIMSAEWHMMSAEWHMMSAVNVLMVFICFPPFPHHGSGHESVVTGLGWCQDTVSVSGVTTDGNDECCQSVSPSPCSGCHHPLSSWQLASLSRLPAPDKMWSPDWVVMMVIAHWLIISQIFNNPQESAVILAASPGSPWRQECRALSSAEWRDLLNSCDYKCSIAPK